MSYGPDLQFNWRAPGRVIFGAGLVTRLGTEAAAMGATRALIVTDPFLAGSTDIIERASQSLAEAGIIVQVFAEVESDPSVKTVEKGAAAARTFGPDLFVGIGGGSSMDAAKAIDMIYVCGDAVFDHIGSNTVKQELHPIIAVPTTAGTGAEMSVGAVIFDPERQTKVVLAEPAFIPKLAVLDPELTLGLPPRLTAATGMDAHAHALDVLHSSRRQPFNDALAIHCVRNVHRYLRRAHDDPQDLEARGQMLAAASSMGFALSTTPYGVIHALGHPLGAHFRIHHGTCVALLSAPSLRWNLQAAESIYADVARGAGLASGGSDSSAAGALIDATDQLMSDLELPRRLSEVGVDEAGLESLSDDAMRDYGSLFNLRRPGSAAELLEVYQSTF